MLSRNELVNRVYSGKVIVCFDWFTEPDDNGIRERVEFQRIDDRHWTVSMLRTHTDIDQGFSGHAVHVQSAEFEVPSSEWPLEYIARRGLLAIYILLTDDYAATSQAAAKVYGATVTEE